LEEILVWEFDMMNSIKILSVTKKKKGLDVVKIFSKDKARLWPFKKSKIKQVKKGFRGEAVKMRDDNLCKNYVYTRNKCLVYNGK